mmetsp:Transcript_10737/g.25650  ORF Transcript_10737/g.25650 Transcript_10737/m.25650 type:complete len:223 (-) Transcript_10737:100-768(-)
MQNRLQVVPFPRVLRVKQFQKARDEVGVDVLASHLRLRRARDHETQEELVDNVEMGPGGLEDRLVLLRVKGRVARARRQRPEDVRRDHSDNFGHDRLAEGLLSAVHVINKFQQRLAFDLFVPVISRIVGEIADDATEPHLADKEVGTLAVRYLFERGEVLDCLMTSSAARPRRHLSSRRWCFVKTRSSMIQPDVPTRENATTPKRDTRSSSATATDGLSRAL